ncbi:MAG: MIP/aquaporin family protein [Phycisphaerales bacterium]
MLDALAAHWPEYLIEAILLGSFMLSACLAVVAMEHPRSPLARAGRSPTSRRVIIAILMGLTAIALIYSPLGQRSGAHMNPGTTLTFLMLGKIKPWDTFFYIVAQFAGGLMGVAASRMALGRSLGHERVNYAATLPGKRGMGVAWAAEFAISFAMMGMVLLSTNHDRTAPYTGIFAGLLVAVFIAVEAPLSGMSMNPARTLASALPARAFRGLWIYFTAPPLAMLSAAVLYMVTSGAEHVYCSKLNHRGHARCIFDCRIAAMPGRPETPIAPHGIQRP